MAGVKSKVRLAQPNEHPHEQGSTARGFERKAPWEEYPGSAFACTQEEALYERFARGAGDW